MTTPLTNVLRALLACAILVTLAACSSGPPKPDVDYKQDYDFREARKLAFYRDSGAVSGDNPLQLSDMQKDRVNEALQNALVYRGFEFVSDPNDADLLVSWHLITQNKTDVRTYDTPAYGGAYYGGYSRYNRYSMYNCWNCAPTRTEVSVQNYTQGSFIVDMIDPKLRKSVWRAITQSKLKGQLDEDQGKYNEAAATIFAAFPPY
jgi:hypothetical protein